LPRSRAPGQAWNLKKDWTKKRGAVAPLVGVGYPT